MTSSTVQHPSYSDTEPFPVGYNSTILELFIESLGRWKDVQILDVGPICRENITFFARQGSRHWVCDMFIRLHRTLGPKPESPDIFRDLDYPSSSFDGIQLWDLIDHLNDDQARQLIKRCLEMLKANGLLMLIALEKKPDPPAINTFVVSGKYRMDFRLQPHLTLPWYCRHNRALVSLLADFNSVKLFRYRNGLREFLFKKPGNARD